MKAIILAAGYATRLYPLTTHTPKALLPIKGKPNLDLIIENLQKIDEINEIILVSNGKFYDIFLEWSKSYKGKIPLDIVNDHTTSNETRLGAIGDIMLAIKEKNINEDTVILASDNYFSFDLKDVYDYYKEKNADTLIASYADEKTLKQRRYAIAVLDSNNKILDFEEKPEHPKTNTIVHSIYFYKKESLSLLNQYIEEGNSKDALGFFPSWLCKKKATYCYVADGECYDIGTIDTYNELNK